MNKGNTGALRLQANRGQQPALPFCRARNIHQRQENFTPRGDSTYDCVVCGACLANVAGVITV